MNNNFTIPIIVQGQALTGNIDPVKRQSSKPPHRRDHQVLIVGDNHVRLCAKKSNPK
jgi:hypothetical protein